ncbi:MAG: Sapep family Mn(2+)-dependent dipeptidase [Firmicutes bacterium]|nr:Sapep family Mn(2+)-dependent dipeptidase [Bacillota bacterium]
MKYEQEIKAYFDQHWFEVMRDVARICSINSEKMPTKEGMPFGEGPYQALCEFGKMAEEKGFSMKTYGNAVGSVDLSDAPRQIDILAHLDVVPAGEGWTVTQPFDVIMKDGKIYGRGTADDKGPAVVALWALKCVKDLGIPLSKSARVVVGTDEECGSGDLPYYYAEQAEAPMTFSPDAEYPVINTEKGAFRPEFFASWEDDLALPRVISMSGSLKMNVLPGKAYATVEGVSIEEMKKVADEVTEKTGVRYLLEEAEGAVKITAVGEGAHAASPEKGNNALTALIEYLCALPLAASVATSKLFALKKLFPHGDSWGKGIGVAMQDDLSGILTLTFSMMNWTRTGFTGQFDSRVPVCANDENMKEVVRKNLAAEGIAIDDSEMIPPHHVSGESPFVKELLAVYEEYTGQKGECMAIGGGTYVHHLENGVAFGCAMPGTDNRMHGADEFAVIEELIISAKMFAQIIADLCE